MPQGQPTLADTTEPTLNDVIARLDGIDQRLDGIENHMESLCTR